MNGLSLISFFNAYSFIILGIYILKLNHKELLNILAAIVDFCFAIWALSYTFFYSAPTLSEAMFWHKTGSIGWILFCVVATHFFLILSEVGKGRHSLKWYLLLYTLPVTLVLKSLLSPETPVAKGLVQSSSGLGWTYDSNIKSIWFWLYTLHILIYFCIALYVTYDWAKKSNKIRFLKQAKSLIILDVIMIIIGFFTDLILPAISSVIPPTFNLISIVWGISFFYIARTYRIMNVYDTTSPDLILKTVMDPIIMLDKDGIIITCNQATEDLFKYSREEMINKPLSYFCKAKEGDQLELNMIFEKKVVKSTEIDLVDSNGNIINGLASISVAEDNLDGLVGLVVSIHDITRLKKIEAELYKRKEKYKELSMYLNRLANYDKLTGIPNRRLFFHKLEAAIEDYKRLGKEFVLVFIDLDGFKAVNDSYGHDIGDLLLVNVSKIFVESIRKQDVIARVGGDEFVIIISDMQNDFIVDETIQRMKERFSQSIIINNKICPIGISYGISKCPEDGITTDELMKISDERMYENKSSKKTLARR